MSLFVFSVIVTLLLSGVRSLRQSQELLQKKQDLLATAQMALQTKQDQLEMNGQIVQVKRTEGAVRVYSEGEEILHVVKK